ncbi:MAG TPA: Fic family protein [Tepidisphaeraceae bacterium]|jgi:hypothetical protein|nr:Fic family protein [Tepidisphaeraceae bacterium]
MSDETSRPAGYAALVQRFKLSAMTNWHQSACITGSTHREQLINGQIFEIYPPKYWPGERLGEQLEFAVKYDGTNLQILAELFAVVPEIELSTYIRSKPTGKYARRIWYLYELLTGKRLPINDLEQGNYIDLLDSEQYYTSAGISVQRQRVRDNLPGDARFCPTVRRTKRLVDYESSGLAEQCRKVMAGYPVELMHRALGYLYLKESKSSFEIEHITPSATRTERFVAQLQMAEREDFFNKPRLIDLQNRIVDERFRDADFRSSQNYVGQTIAWKEKIHFVSPRPSDLNVLMEGMFECHRRLEAGDVHPIIHAANIAYGFVFMHPFEDGNGRIHRFLIHNILARRAFTPPGMMFPVSAVMLKKSAAYDASLEAFSRPLMERVDYQLDDDGRMKVHNDTGNYYRFIDMTAQAEALFQFIQETIETELVEELTFLLNYDRTKRALQEIVDMPDRLIDLFIRSCLQNHGRLSKRKRGDWFANLGDTEVAEMEAAVGREYEVA